MAPLLAPRIVGLVMVALAASPPAVASVTVADDAAMLRLDEPSGRKELSLPSITGRVHSIVAGKEVDLRSGKTRVAGTVGERRLTVAVKQHRQGFEVEGTFDDRRVALEVSPSKISGVIGPCQYTLAAAGSRYRGWKSCIPGVIPSKVVLTLPAKMANLKDVQRAAALLGVLAPQSRDLKPGLGAKQTTPQTSITGVERLGPADMERRYGFAVRPAHGADGAGAQIISVVPASRAAAAGLRTGTIIVSADGQPVRDGSDLRRIFDRASWAVPFELEIVEPHTERRSVIAYPPP